MKQGIHPAYGPVAFRDRTTGDLVLTRSTLVERAGAPGPDTRGTERGAEPGAAPGIGPTVERDGVTYPVVDVDVSVHSHPYWTGRGRVLDAEGRVEAFERRYGRRGDRDRGRSAR